MLHRRLNKWLAAGLVAGVGLCGNTPLLAQVTAPPSIRSLPPLSVSTSAADPGPVAKLPAAPAIPAPPPVASVPTPPVVSVPHAPSAVPAYVHPNLPAGPAVPAASCPTCAAPAAAAPPASKWPAYTPIPKPGFFQVIPFEVGQPATLVDAVQGVNADAAPKYPYPRFTLIPWSFYDVNWNYLDNPANTETDYFDFLKRQRFGDNIVVNTGGDLRYRYMFEENSRLLNTGPRAGKDQTYHNYRARLYSDIIIGDRLRVFVEGHGAWAGGQELSPLPIDRNHGDLLNAFVDARLFDIDDGPVTLRVGRQELLYGSQRLVSPLEWANSRRTFQGAKLFWRGENDNLDAFMVQPVLPNADQFDSVDNNKWFGGLWYTHRFDANSALDLYYLFLDDANNVNVGRGGVKGGQTVHTVGARSVGKSGGFLWDWEGMLQGGENANQNLYAYSGTAGVGYVFEDVAWKPTFWALYDYASGTQNPGNGATNTTFNQLFPFGHYYMGWADLVGRRNIQDLNFHLQFYPTNWINAQVQYHNFWLASRRDALYNAAGNPTRVDPTGRSGRWVGSELDYIVNFHVTKHSDFLISYSYLWAGDFIKKTAVNARAKQDPQALYVQYTYRF